MGRKTTNVKKQQHPEKLPSIQPNTIIQLARADLCSLNSAGVLQRTIGNQAVGQLMSEHLSNDKHPKKKSLCNVSLNPSSARLKLDEEELLQGKFETIQRQELDEEEILQGRDADHLDY